jgi:hypothetical protein
MQRFLGAIAVALLLTLGSVDAALAGTKWCAVDPIVTVDGRTSDVTVGFDAAYIPSLLPPVVFRFHVPSNSKASVTMPAAPIAYTVEVQYDLPARQKKDPVTVTVEALVPASEIFPTQTVVSARAFTIGVLGTSASTTTISYTLR